MSSVGDTEISTEMRAEGVSPPAGLLERERELERLDSLLASAAEGSGNALLIRGEAGIGKTRLMAALGDRAQAAGFTVLTARGGVLESDFPFGCVRQLFEQRLADPDLPSPLQDDAAMSAPVFGAPAEGRNRPDAGFGVLHGLYWLTANLAEPGPLLIAVDDAHWADPPSLRYLSFLARRLEGLPVAVVVATRADEPGAPPELAALGAETAVATADLEPLSEPAAAELVRAGAEGEVSERVCRLCHEATGGNPFLLGELLRELQDDAGGMSPERIEALGPDRVAEAVARRIEGVGPGAADLASAVALLGDGVEVRIAARLAGLGDEAGELADGLAAIGVLAERRPLGFLHPIVRNAVYGRIPPAQRHRGHLEAAAMLREAGERPESVAAHLLATEPGERFEPVEVLLEAAAEASARGAPDLALRYLERALAEPPSEELRPRVLTELGRAASVLGDPRGFDWLREAVELGNSSPAGVSAAIALGRALTFAGRTDEAMEVGRRLLSGGDGANPRLERWLISLAQLTPSSRRPAVQMVRDNLEAARAGQELNAGVTAAAAIEAALTDGDGELAADLAERAVRTWLTEKERPENLEPGLAIATFILTERFQRAETLLEGILDDARRTGSIRLYAGAYSFRAWVRQRQGKLRDVLADAELYPDFPQAAVTDLVLAGAHIQALIETGDQDRAAAVAARAEAMALDDELALYQRFAEGLAALRLDQGDHRAALEVTAGMARWERESGQSAGTWVPWRLQAARAHAALGEPDRASELVSEQVALARAFGTPGMTGSALLVQGGLTGGDEGIRLLEEAAACLEGSGMRLEHSRALVALGAARRRAGRPSDARAELRTGLEQARRCGASALEEQALEELIAAGGRPRRAADEARDALTPSERRVAGMAAQGMSNKEIAQALFVTVRTVETHLFNSYRKLQIKSRSQLKSALSG